MPGSVSTPGSTQPFNTNGAANSLLQLDSAGGATAVHYLSAGNVPTAVAGAGAGTAPPAPVIASTSTDTRGSVTGGTGTSPSTGALITVEFNVAFAATPFVALTPINAATAAMEFYVTSITATGFTIALASVPSGSQANTTYGWNWSVIG